ncbi:MAG TPA: nickel-dependent hydrogenase large subunit [Gemmatimonadales bacterium]|nr:nickel-dependent hydrogenase large subunit [Gemmatimonadales bacterium]
MGANRAVVVRHVTRIEGHGNIVVDLEGDTIRRCDLEIVEAPRFFEALLRGRPYDEAPRIACRICGICSVGHATASVHAVEAALGITPGPKLRVVRRLNMAGEWLQSHVLHVCFLVAPDALGVPSIVPLVGSHPDVVKRALRLKRLANDVCCTVSGRHVMPISYHAGWMGHWPDRSELRALQEQLIAAEEDLDALVELFAALSWPQVERSTELLAALEPGGAYPMMGGPLHSTSGTVTAPEAYGDVLHEYLVDHSASKHVRGTGGGGTIRVGALARYALAHDRLHPRARDAARRLGLRPGSGNPFDFVAAQLVESVQAHQEAVEAVSSLLADPAPEEPARPTRPEGGRGVGMVEVPRGTLVHDYTIGADGRLAAANCIIPTSQNLASIEADMRAFLPSLVGRPSPEIAHGLEMLVRAYDPCVSCSVH